MSSYVISKIDYARLAGTLAGIGTQKDYYKEQVFYKYSWKNQRIYTAEDFKEEIMRLYDLNAVSVMKQYHDPAREEDENSYDNEFEKYFKKAADLYHKAHTYGTIDDRSEFEKLCYYIEDFFDSVSYQIEDEECENEARKIMFWYSHNLAKLLKNLKIGHESLTWGDFNYFEEGAAA